MKNKKLRKYLVTSLGVLSSLASNGVVMASTDVLPTYVPASPQFSSNPITSNNKPKNDNVKQHSLPDNVLTKNSKKVPVLPSVSTVISNVQPQQSASSGSGLSKIFWFGLGIGATYGSQYIYGKLFADPTLNLNSPLDVHLFNLALQGSNYYNRVENYDDTTVNYKFGDEDAVPLNKDRLKNYEQVKYVFLALKDCLNKLLECNEFKQLSFEAESKKDFKRENAILESFNTFLGLPSIENGKWNCEKYFINDSGSKVNYIAAEMPDGTYVVSSTIQDDEDKRLCYNAIFDMKNGKLSFDRLDNLSID